MYPRWVTVYGIFLLWVPLSHPSFVDRYMCTSERFNRCPVLGLLWSYLDLWPQDQFSEEFLYMHATKGCCLYLLVSAFTRHSPDIALKRKNTYTHIYFRYTYCVILYPGTHPINTTVDINFAHKFIFVCCILMSVSNV